MKSFIEQPSFLVAEFMDFAMFDDDAAPAEKALLDKVEAMPPGSLLPIDFSNVHIASAAARRLLKRPVRRITGGEVEDRYLILNDLGRNRDNVQIMLTGEEIVMVERVADTKIELRGKPDVAVAETFALLLRFPSITASALKEELGLTNISTATNRLANLTKLGLARRVDHRTVQGGGREYVFAPVR